MLDVSDKLSGSLDYLLRSTQELIVIEAKKKDVDSGFNQLAAEMIALDKYDDGRWATSGNTAEVFAVLMGIVG